VIGLSGGMDSATLLGVLLDKGYEVYCCIFHYGSTHGPYETAAADSIIDYYQDAFPGKLHKHNIDIKPVMAPFSSNLLVACEEEIPEGHYNQENMKKTIVPGRNLIFASILAGLAESIGASIVALGVHSGDHHIYPDCRPDFVEAVAQAVFLSSDGKVEVVAPLLFDDKESILQKGFSLHPPVPYHLTRTCYKNQEVSCGKCGSCRERLEAFDKIEVTDPIIYEGNE